MPTPGNINLQGRRETPSALWKELSRLETLLILLKTQSAVVLEASLEVA